MPIQLPYSEQREKLQSLIMANTKRLNSANKETDVYLQKTKAIYPAFLQTKLNQVADMFPEYEEVKKAEQILSKSQSHLKYLKSKLSIQAICEKTIGKLCVDWKTGEPIDPVGEPDKTNIDDAFRQIIGTRCADQTDKETIDKYTAAKFINDDNPHTVGELAEYLSFDCRILSNPESWYNAIH